MKIESGTRLLMTLWLAIIPSLILVACSEKEPQNTALKAGEATQKESSHPKSYDVNSWKTLIPSDCKSFFDGCNTCRRAPDAEMAACTRKACFEYSKPKCLDDVATVGDAPNLLEAKVIHYVCTEGNQFTVYIGEYQVDDQKMRLTKDEIMLSDRQTKTVAKLQREKSGSGAKYRVGTLTFWMHGDMAMLQQDNKDVYENCEEQN